MTNDEPDSDGDTSEATDDARARPRLSVIVPVRNRAGLRLDNCLRSLRWQDAEPTDYEIVISDFGSDPDSLASVRALALAHDARVVHTPTDEIWNRSRALNIGIQAARAEYVLCTDADMLFAPSFLTVIIDTLAATPDAIVHCDCLDLPEHVGERAWTLDELDGLRAAASRRDTGGTGACQAARTSFFHEARGYDEKYLHWGNEDVDMTSRAQIYGLRLVWISDRTFMLHQWHRRINRDKKFQRRLNYWRYIFTRRRVRKNPKGWGTLP